MQLVLVMAPFADANSLAGVQAGTEFDELLQPASAHIRGCTLRSLFPPPSPLFVGRSFGADKGLVFRCRDPVDLFSLMTYDFSHAGR